MKIVALNGPPLAGKTTIAKYLAYRWKFNVIEPSQMFKQTAHELCGATWTDEQKDSPQKGLGGRAPRDLYIDLATVVESYDPTIWVRRAVTSVIDKAGGREFAQGVFVLDALGKQAQMDWLRDNFLHEDLFVVFVHRPGYAFTDGREWVDSGPIRHVAVVNGGTLDTLYALIGDSDWAIRRVGLHAS